MPFGQLHVVRREAWQTRWRTAEDLWVPAVGIFVPVLSETIATTTWMDRSRSVSWGWQRTLHGPWATPNFSWPLEVTFRPGLAWSKNATSTEGPCSNRPCDTYVSSEDRGLGNATYTMYYVAGTNVPVQVVVAVPVFPWARLVLSAVTWLTGSDVPPVPEVQPGAPRYPPEPLCSDHKAQGPCEAVLSSYCRWCPAVSTCVQAHTAPLECSSFGSREQCPGGRCSWCDGSIGCTDGSSSQGVRKPVRPPELPCAAHVVAETSLNGMVFVRDELWKDHDAFAWRTALWALSSLQSTVYRYLKPYNYSTIWRDDLARTFNSTDQYSCRVTPLAPRTFWFGPVNFSTLDVVGITRNTVVEGRRVDVLHATGTTLGIESPYDLVYAAGTDTLVSFNGSFFFGAIGLTVPVVCRVHVFEQRIPISDAVFAPRQPCVGAQARKRPPASDAFTRSCYASYVGSDSASAAEDILRNGLHHRTTAAPAAPATSRRATVRLPELPCSAHVVAVTSLAGIVYVRDELWRDQGAFAWRTQFWAASQQESIYAVLRPYDYLAVWRDDLARTFNATSNTSCTVTPLLPRRFWFGPVNFSTLDVAGVTRNVAAGGRQVDVYHARGTTLGMASPYDVVYAAGTDVLLSFNGSFYSDDLGMDIPVACSVLTFDARSPVAGAAFAPPRQCVGGPFAARPPASSAFAQACYVARPARALGAPEVAEGSARTSAVRALPLLLAGLVASRA
eukprot:m51a1_g6857 hypothetical protein (730) ;mRNA; r:123755-126990